MSISLNKRIIIFFTVLVIISGCSTSDSEQEFAMVANYVPMSDLTEQSKNGFAF